MDKRGAAEGLAWFVALVVIVIILATFALIVAPMAASWKSSDYGKISDYYAYKKESSSLISLNQHTTNSILVLRLSPSFSAVRNIYADEYILGFSDAGVFNQFNNLVYLQKNDDLKSLFLSFLLKTYNFNLEEYKKLDVKDKNACFGISNGGVAMGINYANILDSYGGFSSCNALMGGGSYCDFWPVKSGINLKTNEYLKDVAGRVTGHKFSLFGVTIEGCTVGR